MTYVSVSAVLPASSLLLTSVVQTFDNQRQDKCTVQRWPGSCSSTVELGKRMMPAETKTTQDPRSMVLAKRRRDVQFGKYPQSSGGPEQ
ncbi:hypothetical protein BP6252_10019 [Coleophoma cylindrospora]|uniref:Secreted protein n=1 Tax=Coleophoma cylindrospora TaxID=1849047 RepID=A0A3D8QXW6_9HELO|nr:hypothetical protein BP6252_10019 [Coleophoma cylindrospora]